MEGFLDIEFIIVQSTNILTNHYYHVLYLDLEAFTSALLAFLEVSLIWDVNNMFFFYLSKANENEMATLNYIKTQYYYKYVSFFLF